MEVIAEQKLLAVFSGGETTHVCLRVGRPNPQPDGDWACMVQAEGLRLWEGPNEIFGVGSWHALMLGIRFLHSMMSKEAKRGAAFYCEGGEHAVSIEELFTRHEIDESYDSSGGGG